MTSTNEPIKRDPHVTTGLDTVRLYNLRFDRASVTRKARLWEVIVRRFFQRWVGPDDVVLDLGCGYGEFINNIRCRRRLAVDLNPDSAGFLDQDVEYHRTSVCDLAFLGDASVDVVFTSNLMEHLPDKPAVVRMLSESCRVLKPGGHFVAMGPNIRLLPGTYWDFWDHIVPISDRSLAEVLTTLGFQVVTCLPRFLPYTTCSSLPQSPWLVRLYLALPMFWPLFGRQFLLRARK